MSTKMTKRIVFVIVALLVVTIFGACLSGCGNANWGFGNYTFTHVHISDGVEGHCATVNSWHDNERGIELHTQEFGDIYCSEGTYFLFSNADGCPYCED